MAVEMEYPHVEKSAGWPARLRRLPRIRVAQLVMDYLAHGWSPDEMCRQHPYLRPAEAHAAMAYYFDHQRDIDEEIAAEWRQAQQERAGGFVSPFYLRLKSKGLL